MQTAELPQAEDILLLKLRLGIIGIYKAEGREGVKDRVHGGIHLLS